MTDRYVRAALAAARLDQTTIAAVAGVSKSVVSRCLSGEKRSPRVAAVIANAVGLTAADVDALLRRPR